eukprot:844055-Pleurochrysis_carterae.AAC.1
MDTLSYKHLPPFLLFGAQYRSENNTFTYGYAHARASHFFATSGNLELCGLFYYTYTTLHIYYENNYQPQETQAARGSLSHNSTCMELQAFIHSQLTLSELDYNARLLRYSNAALCLQLYRMTAHFMGPRCLSCSLKFKLTNASRNLQFHTWECPSTSRRATKARSDSQVPMPFQECCRWPSNKYHGRVYCASRWFRLFALYPCSIPAKSCRPAPPHLSRVPSIHGEATRAVLHLQKQHTAQGIFTRGSSSSPEPEKKRQQGADTRGSAVTWKPCYCEAECSRWARAWCALATQVACAPIAASHGSPRPGHAAGRHRSPTTAAAWALAAVCASM